MGTESCFLGFVLIRAECRFVLVDVVETKGIDIDF